MAEIDVKAFGLAFGIVWAASVFLIGAGSALTGAMTMLVDLIASFYPGFGPHIQGSLLGAVYGFIDGFIYGAVIAWLYNKFAQ